MVGDQGGVARLERAARGYAVWALINVGLVVAGGFLTLATYNAASPGGQYVLFIGAVGGGLLFAIINGVRYFLTLSALIRVTEAAERLGEPGGTKTKSWGNLDELQGFGSQESTSEPQRPSRRWPYIVSIVILCLISAGLGAGFAYSTNSAQEWRASATRTSDDLATMTKQRDGLKAQAGDLQTKLSDMTTQFNTATDRIRSLSNEKAQAGDQAASFATLLAMSQQVTKEMDLCISDQQNFMSYLANYRASEYTSAMNSARQSDTDCNRARADSNALSKKLGG